MAERLLVDRDFTATYVGDGGCDGVAVGAALSPGLALGPGLGAAFWGEGIAAGGIRAETLIIFVAVS